MINAFLGTRCVDVPQAECDNTRRVPKKSFITELHTTFFSKKGMKVLLFVTELRKDNFRNAHMKMTISYLNMMS